MTKRWALALALSLTQGMSNTAHAGRSSDVVMEAGTISWSELQVVLHKEGATLPAAARTEAAPLSFALSEAEVRGDLEGSNAELSLQLGVEVIENHWVLVPLLPKNLAVSSAHVDPPPGHRGFLVRTTTGLALVAEGAGSYQVELSAQGKMERTKEGMHLALALPGLTLGHATLTLHNVERVLGKTPWKLSSLAPGLSEASSALGPDGFDVVLPNDEEVDEAGSSIDGLTALTVVSLGGSGVTRLTFHATPSKSGVLELKLPANSRPWKAFVGRKALDASTLLSGEVMRLPLKAAADIEVAYTFSLPPLGIRGRYRTELPRMPVPVRDAHWQLWLPNGLRYDETQASMATDSTCADPLATAKTTLTGQGRCSSFSRAVLEPGTAAYVEGNYQQAL